MRESNEYPSASFRMIAVIALLVGVGAGVFAFFSFVLPSLSDDGKTVYIQADNSPIKTPPSQPGGMDIPHQDKLVFNSVTSPSARQNPPERLAPPPEEPVYGSGANTPAIQSGSGTPAQENLVQIPAGRTDAPGVRAAAPAANSNVPAALGRAIQPGSNAPVATAPIKPSEITTSFDPAKPEGDKAGKKVVKTAEPTKESPEFPVAIKSGSGAAEAPEEEATTTVAEASAPPLSITPTIQQPEAPENPLMATEEVQEQKIAALTPGQSSGSGAARFQLASYTDRAAAEAGVKAMESKYSGALGGASLQVTSGTVKGKQVFRVQGSAASKEEMESICSRVKASGGACVPAR